jgi:hypothetical protein
MSKKALFVVLIASAVMLAAGVEPTRAVTPAQEPEPPGGSVPETLHPKGGARPVQAASAAKNQAAMQAPPLSDFIDILLDGVDNYNPAVAYNSKHDEYLVVWENDRGATRDIYAQRVTGDGDLKSSFTVISNANKWNWLPDVAYSAAQDEYLIVYAYNHSSSDYDIYARRVRWDGSWMSTEIAINQDADKQWYPAVAYNSQNEEYLVVYENYWAGGLRDIAAQRVKASDGTLPSWRNIATAPGTVRRLPDVAYNAARNEYLIAYTYQHATNGDIYGKVASANLGTLSNEIYIVPNTNDQDGVALAAGPNEYLAVWEDGPSGSYRTIYGRRVTGTDTLHPYIPIADHSGEACIEPAVAYGDIYGYLVTWRYASSGASGDDVYGRYVKAGQDSAWGSEFAIDDTSNSQRSPALACAPYGDCLLVEEDNWAFGGPGDYEIRGRLVMAHRVYLPLVVRNLQ